MKNVLSRLLLSTVLVLVVAAPAMAASKHVDPLGGKIRPLIIVPKTTAAVVVGGNTIGLLGSIPLIGKSGALGFKNNTKYAGQATYTQSEINIPGGVSVMDTITYKSGKVVQDDFTTNNSSNESTTTETITTTQNGITKTKNITLNEQYVGNQTDDISESITVGNKTLSYSGTEAYSGLNGGEYLVGLHNAKGQTENLTLVESKIYNGGPGNSVGLTLTTTGTDFTGKSVNTQVTETY